MAKYRGVCPNKGKFRVQIGSVRDPRTPKFYHLGYFDDDVEAAMVYDVAAKTLQGPNAVLNFPKQKPSLALFEFVLNMLVRHGLVRADDKQAWDYWGRYCDPPKRPGARPFGRLRS